MTQPLPDIELRMVDPRETDAVTCLTAFYGELATRLKSGFDVHLSADPNATDMMPPKGAFFVAYIDGAPVACGGLKGHGDWGEVKRVWVSPNARGLKLASRLMDRIEEEARALNMSALRLDTNSALPEAIALYKRLGWHEVDRFNDDPYPDHFFEKSLG